MANWRSTLTEALLISLAGAALALLANWISPRGLSLTRDYFGRSGASSPPPALSSTTEATPTNATAVRPASDKEAAVSAATEYADLKQRLQAKGISLMDGPEAEKLYRDPQYQQELIIFVDARDDHHYNEGHIPGAFQFDRYYPEKYLPTVLPACLTASRIVVYCTGGKCEDSEFAAMTLAEAGVPPQNLAVYAGGITDWQARKGSMESGPRKSGNIRETP